MFRRSSNELGSKNLIDDINRLSVLKETVRNLTEDEYLSIFEHNSSLMSFCEHVSEKEDLLESTNCQLVLNKYFEAIRLK